MTLNCLPPIRFSEVLSIGNFRKGENEWYLAFVPLELISFKSWNLFREEENMAMIKSYENVIPVDLGDWNEEKTKYSVSDGNHRCYCANQLGYTHIPAIINKETRNPRFVQLDYRNKLKDFDKEIGECLDWETLDAESIKEISIERSALSQLMLYEFESVQIFTHH